jgi:hypothetical protein
MSYSAITGSELKANFGVEWEYQAELFRRITPRPASEWLRLMLKETIPFALTFGSEKARSEYIIAPIFFELRQQASKKISVFSGIEFNVDRKRKLSGFCDFLVSRAPSQNILEAPVVVAVEAKRQDFEKGITQCLAEMIAARIFNERRGHPIEEVYGCVTTGDVWRFLALRGSKAEIESRPFAVPDDLEEILGLLWAMTFGEVEY